jgi:predicted dehydrogenase
MSAAPLRIGFVGAGENTRVRHLPGFRVLPGVELSVVANRTVESATRVARSHGIARVAADWREVVTAPDVDAVCVGTWPYLHAEVTCAALRAGKHVLTEARMASDLAQAEAMLAEARRHPHLVAQIVPAPLTLPMDAIIRELIAGGHLGELREVTVTHTTGQFWSADAPRSWRQDRGWSGCNTLSLGIYYETLLRWLDQDAEVVGADAAVYTPSRRDPESGELRAVETPDTLTVLARYPSGARLTMHLSAIEGGPGRNEVRLNGSRACLRVDIAAGTLTLTAHGEPPRALAVPSLPDAGWRVEADFVASIRDGLPVRLTDFATGVRYMRFTEAAWRAWRAVAP